MHFDKYIMKSFRTPLYFNLELTKEHLSQHFIPKILFVIKKCNSIMKHPVFLFKRP